MKKLILMVVALVLFAGSAFAVDVKTDNVNIDITVSPASAIVIQDFSGNDLTDLALTISNPDSDMTSATGNFQVVGSSNYATSLQVTGTASTSDFSINVTQTASGFTGSYSGASGFIDKYDVTVTGLASDWEDLAAEFYDNEFTVVVTLQ